MLPFIIAGLTTGSVYGLAAVGLVLTYKTSGVLNFAHGALATVTAYLFYTLHVQHGMNWILAAVLCVFVVGPVLGIALELVARVLLSASLATRVVSTVGLLLIVEAGVTILYGLTVTRTVPEFFPSQSFTISGTTISLAQVIIFAVGVAATGGLYAYLRATRTGIAMRAVVDSADLLDAAGTSPVRVRRLSWIIGVTFACGSGVLVVAIPPPVTLDPLGLTFLVIAAFGAAAIGSFTSLPLTYLGGLVIGIGAALCTEYFTSGALSELSVSLPFLVLFLVLLVSPGRRLADRARVIPRTTSTWQTPWRIQLGAGIAVVAFLLFVPQYGFVGFHLQDYTTGLALTVLFLSLGLLTRTSGQVSLAHVSFMAIGVCAFAQLQGGQHWPWAAALLAAGLIAMPIGAVLAIPAIRLSGPYLALATFGFGLLLQYMFYPQNFMFGADGLGITLSRPDLSLFSLNTATDSGYYYLVLLIAIVVAVAMIGVNRSRLGRLLRGLADSPTGLAASGTSVNVTRVLVFSASAFLAAIAGVLAAGALAAGGTVTVTGDSYPPIQSLTYFALVVITVGGAPWYAVTAGFLTALIPSYLVNPDVSNVMTLIFGAAAVAYSVTPARYTGTAPAVQRFLDRLGGRPPGSGPAPGRPALSAVPVPVPEPEPEPEPTREPRPRIAAGDGLRVRGLRVVFGGVVALNGADLHAPTGRVTGLIGPNGAGKTTLFNACSGLLRPQQGVLTLDGHPFSRLGPPARARRGIGRTFQQMELFDSLTVRANVALGAEGASAGLNMFSHLMSSPKAKRRADQATDDALAQCDLRDLAERNVGSLSTGQRRLVELARCLAGTYRVLLLDEPSSGLDRAETAKFGAILRRVVTGTGVGILLVEHDMSLVTEICDYIYVLDFGQQIFEGTPAQVMASPTVQAAYLGDEADTALTSAEADLALPDGPETEAVR